MTDSVTSCPVCGLVQEIPTLEVEEVAVCVRCRSVLGRCSGLRNSLTVGCALAALVLYLPAMSLPLLRIERLGHVKEDSLVSGVATLFADGYWLVGIVVLLFSVVLPPLKLVTLAALAGTPMLGHGRHRATAHRALDVVGRWGMLDVMLVAVLVAFIKLGNLVQISAGPGLVAFTSLVLLSLVAGMLFSSRCLWEEPR